MNEFKGTPGPWEVVEHEHEEYGLKENCKHAIMATGELPYQLATVVFDEIFDKAQANANLMAASPKLFKVVNDLLNHFEGNIPLWLFEEAENAVADALGK